MKKIADKEPHKAFDYLREVYDLAIYMGKYNKPLLINVNGLISGSAASIFTRAPFALGSKNTKWRLNETSLGYIPDAGASYYLSRLNMELGTFLGLTGWAIDGYDMSRSGIAFERMFVTHRNIEENWKVCHQKHDEATTSQDLFGRNKYVDVEKQELFKDQYLAHLNEELYQRIHRQDQVQFRNESKRLAMAEILYKHQMVDRANLGYDRDDLFNKSHEVLNKLLHYESCVMYDLGLENIEPQTSGTVTRLPLFTIGRCFSANTVEQIIERLREEDTHFTRACIQSLESKSPLALKLTLQLIREGQNSSWKQCFEREFRVACRRLLDPEIMRCIEAEIVGNEKSFNNWDFKTLNSISKDQVLSYFRPLAEEKKFEGISEFEGDLNENCLYPTKDYYRDYPDTVRFYLNQDSLNNVHLREAQEYDVHEFLQYHKINSKNPAISIPDLREKFYLKEKLQRKKDEYLNRLSSLSGSEFSFKNFYETRKSAIDAFFNDKSAVDQKVESFTAEVFEDFRNERLNSIKKISRVAAVEKKENFFMRLRQKIIDTRLMDQTEFENIDQDTNQMHGLQYPLFFPFDNKENIIDSPNPYVKTLFKDLLDKIDIQSRGTLIKSFKFDMKEIEKMMEEKEFGKKIINRLTLQYTENSFEKDRRQQFEIRFGDYRGALVEQWYDRLIESGYKVDNIRQFLSSTTNDQVKDILRHNSSDNLKVLVYEFLAELEQDKKFFDENDTIEHKIKDTQAVLDAVKKGMDSFSSIINLENDSKQNPQQNSQAKLYDNSLDLLKKYIKHDQELNDTLSLLFEPASKNNNSIMEKTRQEMLKLLNQILSNKLEQIYGKNNYKSTLMSENGEKTYQFNHVFMERFDNYIQSNLEFDIQQYITTHALFTFSALGLQRLESIFKRIYLATVKSQKEQPDQSISVNQDYTANLLQIFKDYAIEINSTEEIEEVSQYLNNLTTVLSTLYQAYKDQLIFTEDMAFEMSNSSRYAKERESGDLSFANYALLAYEQKSKFVQCIEDIAKSFDIDDDIKYAIDSESKYLQRLLEKPLKLGETKAQRIDQIKQQLQRFDDIKNSKDLISGFVLYAERLDRLTQASIQGKGHFVPQELQIEPEDADIPIVFDKLDSRMNPKQWLDVKLKHFIRKIFDSRYQSEKVLNHHDLLMLDYEISKFLMQDQLKQSIYEELDKDMELLRICREFQVSQRAKTEATVHEFTKDQTMNFQNIKNPKAIEKLQAYRVFRESKFMDRDPDAGEFESSFKIEEELALEAHLAPYGQVESDKEIEKIYLQLLDIPDFSEIDTTRITKEKTLIDEYRITIDHIKNSRVVKKGDNLYDDIELFIKQISV